MTKHIPREHMFYTFDPMATPVARIHPGEEVVLETHDCFEGKIQTELDLVTSLDPNKINPATGPIYIEGAKPGNILRIDLLELTIADQSCMVTIPGKGALGDVIQKMETTILKREESEIVFKDKIRIHQKPMIGVIGVAPESEPIPNSTPGSHGGNMDCTLIGEGASLYLTVNVDGALFGMGDVHAIMGDGEIVVCAAETAAVIRFKAELVELPGLPTPFVETEEIVAAIYSAPTIEAATKGAIHHMAEFLTNLAGLSLNDAGMLMSVVGSLKFCQVVDPEMTVRFEFPKRVLAEYGYRLQG